MCVCVYIYIYIYIYSVVCYIYKEYTISMIEHIWI